MANERDKRNVIQDSEDIELFGAHKTREQIKAEEKARKQAEREAMRRAMAARRAATKSGDTAAPRRFDVWSVVIVMVVIVALGAAALALQFSRSAKNERFERDETRTTYFRAEEAQPDMEEDGVTAAVSEAYYTKGGYLCVQLVLGNGAAEDRLLTAIEVTLVNGTDQQIAGGYAEIPGDIIIPSQETDTYTFYISPEHITLTDDPLTTLGYTVNVTAAPVTE